MATKLLNWRELNAVLTTLDEPTLASLLDAEQNGPKRVDIARRIHQRFCVLRTRRERDELMERLGQ